MVRMPFKLRHPPMINDEKGIALILVLWILTLLTVIVGQFCYTMRTETNITRNFRDDTQGYYLARAGIDRAIREIMLQSNTTPDPAESEEKSVKPWRVNTDIPAVSLGDGQYKVWIDNESGKININDADASLLRMMLAPFNLPLKEENIIVDSIRDWRDKDDLHRAYGAENDYYMSLAEPYQCTNGPFRTTDEILLVRGVTREIFERGLKKMITVHRDPPKKTQGRSFSHQEEKTVYRININAAPPQVLKSFPNMTEEMIQDIVNFRKEKDFRSTTELVKIVGNEVYNAVSRYITLDLSSYYTVTSTGMAEEARVAPEIEVMIRIRPGKKEYRFIHWLDYVGQTQ